MKITIKDEEINIKGGLKANLFFERFVQEDDKIGGLNQLVQYFWCCVVTADSGHEIPYDEFVMWLDENEDKLIDFSEWLNKKQSLVPSKKN